MFYHFLEECDLRTWLARCVCCSRLGLEKNETPPKPVLPEPRVPSKKEKEEAVQFVIPLTGDVSKKSLETLSADYFFFI